MSLRVAPQALERRTNLHRYVADRLCAIYLAEAPLPAVMINNRCSLIVEALHSIFEDGLRIVIALLELFSVEITDASDGGRMTVDIVDVAVRTDSPTRDALQQLLVTYMDADGYYRISNFVQRERAVQPVSLG